MPHFTNDEVYDVALDEIANNCDKMVLLAGVPNNFADANANNGVGSGQKIAEVAMVPGDFTKANGDTSGRKVTSAAKNSQAVIADGNGDHVAFLDTGGGRILHYYELASPRNGLTTADTVNFPVHDLEFADTVAE
ncbi:MAG: hypothetical protein AAFX06_28275 [Planctomycetota bacterium]